VIEQCLWETGWGGEVPDAEDSEPGIAVEEPITRACEGTDDQQPPCAQGTDCGIGHMLFWALVGY
jgi:hypothetical protein